jgi:hypothetical protein
MLIDLGNDHDIFGEASESTSASASVPAADLMSIDQLLETVCPCCKEPIIPSILFFQLSSQFWGIVMIR